MRPIEVVLKRHMELGRRRAERLRRQGDDLTAARTVRHVAYFLLFPWPAERAAAELAAEGYHVTRSTAGFHHVVHFEALAALDENDQAAFLAQVLLIVRRHGGTYEGWRSSPTSPTRHACSGHRQHTEDSDIRRD